MNAEDQYSWDKFVTAHALSPLTQSWAWGELQERRGRKIHRLELRDTRNEMRGVALFVRYPLPLGLSYLYAPRGPVLDAGRPVQEEPALWDALYAKVREIAKDERAIFFRFDPPFERGAMEERLLKDSARDAPHGAYRSAVTQPKIEWHIDLSGTEEEIIARMKEKTRYNVRLAEKKEITVRHAAYGQGHGEYWNTFLQLMRETSRRDKFFLHPQSHYQSIWEIFGTHKGAELIFAEYHHKPLAVALVIHFGSISTYLYGGSSSDERNRMAPYALHWEAIREAKRRGCAFYSMGAVATSHKMRDTSSWSGITRFKQGFGGRAVEYLGAYDIIINPLMYWAAMLARRLSKR